MFPEEYPEKHAEVFLEKLLPKLREQNSRRNLEEFPDEFLVQFCGGSSDKFLNKILVELQKQLKGTIPTLVKKSPEDLPQGFPEKYMYGGVSEGFPGSSEFEKFF